MDLNRAWRRGAVLAVAPLVLAACGSSGSKSSPQAHVDAASKALKNVTALHIEGTQTDKDGPARIKGDVSSNGNVQLTVAQGATAFTLLRVSKQTYLKANAAYWVREANAKVGQVLGGKWVKAPASSVGDIDKQVQTLLPAGLSRCVKTGLGTLKSAGTATVDGTATDVVEDLGDKPGTQPGRLYVAKKGSLPVRVVQTGKRKAGKVADSFCDDPSSTQSTEDVKITYNHPISFRAPPNAIDLDALHGSGTGGQSA